MSETRKTERVPNEELDQLIWGLERYGLYPRQLAALKELRELRKDVAELANTMIKAIEVEQERLFNQDYLMDSKDCIDVIREEMQRLNSSQSAKNAVIPKEAK